MADRLRNRLAALAVLPVLALAGCDWGSTEPVSLSLEFVANHSLNSDGSCVVQFVASASGYGSAQWDHVTVRRSGTVLAEYDGAQTAQFWGEAGIAAGAQQASAPFTAPDAANGVSIEVDYRISGPVRTVTLQPNCSAAATG